MKKKLALSLISGFIISAAALYLAFRNVPFRDLAAYFTTIDYYWVVPSLLLGLSTFVLRAWRWQIILASAKRIDFWPLFHAMMVGFMMNCVLPGRVGEVARPVILKKSDHIPFSTGLATVATERVFDITLIMALFVTVFLSVQIDPDLSMTFGGYELNRGTLTAVGRGMAALFVLIVSVMTLVSMKSTRRIINQAILRMPAVFVFLSPSSKDKLTKNIFEPLVRVIDNTARGFSLVKYPGRIMICLGLSFGVWILQALALYMMAFGCPGIALSFLEICAVLVIICFFIALPSVPGFWGLWEAGGVFALTLFGVSAKEAAGFTLTTHAILMFPVIIVGMVSAMMTGVNILKLSTGNK